MQSGGKPPWLALLLSLCSVAAVAEPHLHLHLNLRHGHHHKRGFGGMPPELSSLLAESQRRLASAEKHHEQVVKKAQERLHGMLMSESSSLVVALRNYSESLELGAANLASVANVTKAKLSEQERSAANTSAEGWGGPVVEERAKLSAKVQLLEREVRRMKRQKDRVLEEACRRAGDTLEDGASRLSRKLGDVSALLEEAKGSLATDLRFVNSNETLVASSLAQMGQALMTAKDRAHAQVAAAGKSFDAALDAVRRSLDAGATSILQDLAEAEKQELASIHGVQSTPPPK